MKIALFLTDDRINNHDVDMIPIMILYTDKKSVVGVDRDFVIKKDVNYLALWLLANKIEELYVMYIDPLTKKLFEKLGVTVHIRNEIKKDHYLKNFFNDIFG